MGKTDTPKLDLWPVSILKLFVDASTPLLPICWHAVDYNEANSEALPMGVITKRQNVKCFALYVTREACED